MSEGHVALHSHSHVLLQLLKQQLDTAMTTIMERLLLAALLLMPLSSCSSFVVRSPTWNPCHNNNGNVPPSFRTSNHHQRLYGNFFQDLIKDAFDNDPNLSDDKSTGQLEGPGNDNSYETSSNTLTDTQLKWRKANPKAFGAPMTPELLGNTKWQVDFFLAGVPSKDPSNDLFGSKTNISSRDRAVGLDVPSEPSVSVNIVLKEGGVCQCSPTDFTTSTPGQWKLSENGRDLRFSVDVVGYTRTVQTKGSLTKVYWSDSDEVTRQTSSSYNIPPGWLYGDISVQYGAKPGTVIMDNDGGVLRVEETMGLLGATSKMVPCGRFTARPIHNADS